MKDARFETLVDNEIELRAVQSSVSLESGSWFDLAVSVDNNSDQEINWPLDGDILNIAYRWFDALGNCIDPDGHRTSLKSPLLAKSSLELVVGGQVPSEPGNYELVLSLVLENVHWACDVFDNGWTRVAVLVDLPAIWPAELSASPGGKALRGALAAAELDEKLKLRSFDVVGLPIATDSGGIVTPEPVPAPALAEQSLRASSPRFLIRLRAWFRHFLGLPETRFAIEELLRRSAIQQDQIEALLQRSAVQQDQSDALLEQTKGNARRADGVDHNISGLLKLLVGQQRSLISMLEEQAGLQNRVDRLHDALLQMRFDVGRSHGAIERQLGDLRKTTITVGNEIRESITAVTRQISSARDDIVTSAADHSSELESLLSQSSLLLAQTIDERRALELKAINDLINESSRMLQDDLGESTRSIISTFSSGSVVDELIAGIRHSNDALINLQRALSELRDSARNSSNDRVIRDIATINEQQVKKLDLLLTREIIPVSAAGLVLIRNPYGLLAVQDDDPAAIAYYSDGTLPEMGTVTVVGKLLKPGDLFMDIGANVGAYTLVAARLTGPSGTVISVEPVPGTASMLRTTAAINGISAQVELCECALGDEEGESSISVGATSGHSSFRPLQSSADTERVKVQIRMGAELLGGRVPAIIKIDVEGYELEVLNGLQPALASSDSNLIVEYSPGHINAAGVTTREWLQQIRRHRRQIWIIHDDPIALKLLTPRESPPKEGFNLLCCNKLPEELLSLVAKGPEK